MILMVTSTDPCNPNWRVMVKPSLRMISSPAYTSCNERSAIPNVPYGESLALINIKEIQ